MIEKIFFQSSFPRAGSTLMQTILHNNPDIYGSITDPFLEYVYAARSNYTSTPEVAAQDEEIAKRAFLGFCNGGLKQYANSLTEGSKKKYLVLKSRGFGKYRGFIDSFYEDPKIIMMVRNLADVVCSYEKIYRNNQHIHDPINNDAQATGGTVYKRVDSWMHPSNTIGRAVERLFDIINQGYDNKILFVKYEDLMLYPNEQMERVYDYFGIPYYEHDFDNINQELLDKDSAYGLGAGLHVVRKKLDMKPSDAKIILGNDICNWLHDNYKWYYDKFNYKK